MEFQSDDSDEEFTQNASQSEAPSGTEERALAGQACNLLLAGEIKKVSFCLYCLRQNGIKKVFWWLFLMFILSYWGCCCGDWPLGLLHARGDDPRFDTPFCRGPCCIRLTSFILTSCCHRYPKTARPGESGPLSPLSHVGTLPSHIRNWVHSQGENIGFATLFPHLT